MKNNIEEPEKLRSLSSVSIVTPAYNEEKNLIHLYERIRSVMEAAGRDFELIIVENGSDDNSLELLKKLHNKDKRVNYLSLTRNFGHQGALFAGLNHTQGDVVVSMDADLQHPPELIPKMLELWEKGFDVVYTTKKQNKTQSFLRRSIDNFFYRIMNKLSGIQLHGQSDFRLLGKKVVDTLCNLPERNKFLRGLTTWIGFRQTGIEYEVCSRFSGESKFCFPHLIKLAIDGIFSFSIIPLRIFTLLGILISGLSFIYGICIVLFKVFTLVSGSSGVIPPGWVTIAFVMLFFGGIQLIGIGLLGEYLGRVYDEVKGRPVYIVNETSLVQDTGISKVEGIGVKYAKK